MAKFVEIVGPFAAGVDKVDDGLKKWFTVDLATHSVRM